MCIEAKPVAESKLKCYKGLSAGPGITFELAACLEAVHKGDLIRHSAM